MPNRPTIISIDPADPDPAVIDQAAGLLRAGALVAFPTETVYGLGADATRDEPVLRLFDAKGRPPTNPLIVHADDLDMARSCVSEWPEIADRLAARFWPGPLTFVLPKSARIADRVTAGRMTVGVRQPALLLTRRLIQAAGLPIAAPSANRSCRISPTLASHVASDLGAAVALILDGGQTPLGLESTVIDLTTREPRILRPGPITAEQIEHALGNVRIRDASGETAAPDEPARSPGLAAVHYAPSTPTFRVEKPEDLRDFDWPSFGRAALIVVGPGNPPPVPVPIDFQFDLTTPRKAERDLYVVLHQCDAAGLDAIVVLLPPDQPEWRALRDRLRRAARPARTR